MNRFFSKLDLRDIKIDPQGSHFPPDADEPEPEDEPVQAANAGVPVRETPAPDAPRRPYVPSWIDTSSTADATPDAEPVPHSDLPGTSRDLDAGLAVNGEEIPHRNGEVLKVSARSRPSAVAGAIAGVVRESGRAEVQAIGAGATNQAVKAVAIARDYLRETGIEAICLPAFIDVTIDNEDRTAMRLVVEPR